MQIKCEYCGSMFSDTMERCPSCGAINNNLNRTATGEPKTIDELKAYFEKRGLTSDKTRFFIGKDYKGAKAFGIYKNEKDEFVVYKNKSDGSRAIRYQGTDEAFAVNEIYQKLKEETINQFKKGNIHRKSSSGGGSKKHNGNRFARKMVILAKKIGIGMVVFVVLFVLGVIFADPSKGYYRYNDNTYYYYNHWYSYDGSDWVRDYSVPDDLANHSGDYYQGSSYDSDYGGYDFSDSSAYDYEYEYDQEQSSSSYDSDWDSDYDYSDWDSDSTDWDSDW